MVTRRELLEGAGAACLTPMLKPVLMTGPSRRKAMRSINVTNFIRGVEPRGPMDLFLPVQRQMETNLELDLPATWLLQYDALIQPRFTDYLKQHMAKDHEVGLWFEMNHPLCDAAGVKWRGRPGYEWDHYPFVAFTIGYTQEERIKLADAAMRGFREVWGRTPKSIACWNLDGFTCDYLTRTYGVDAYATCRDQIATDGFTIWGSPIAGYYPSRTNLWSPAVERRNQIPTPVFRMLGQDPVYYYQSSYPFPDGHRHGGPDTMEPVWPSGRSDVFIQNFLRMVAEEPTLEFAYAQLGQENSFGWPEMGEAYVRQMRALAELIKGGAVRVETMGETGREFKRRFRTTPAQAQVMPIDPFGNTSPPETTYWYQSGRYRSNLHIQDDTPFFRDLTIYGDKYEQPFLKEATTLHDVEQRLPAALDGFHWSPTPGASEPRAAGYLLVDNGRFRVLGTPKVREEGDNLVLELRDAKGTCLTVKFGADRIDISATKARTVGIEFTWDPQRAALVEVKGKRAHFNWQGFRYAVVVNGSAGADLTGWRAEGVGTHLTLQFETA